jgi:peptidoglycan/xylan/chitin deacetylase (PgdA/CDA1 family)
MYHYVRDLKHSRFPQIKGLQTELFKEQVKFLKRHYHFVKVEEVINAYNNNGELPENPVLLTFDDAYADHFETVFPILHHEDIQGAFYPPVKAITEHTVLDVNKIHFILASTPEEKISVLLKEIQILLDTYREEYHLESFEFYFNKLAIANRFDSKEIIFVKRLLQTELPEVLRNNLNNILFQKIIDVEEGAFSRELYMSIDQIKCMVDCGMHVGSHGYDHYWLGSLSKEKQRFEIEKSIAFIKEVGGDINNWSICYPYGNYNDDTIALLKDNGCKLGLTTRVDLADTTLTTNDAVYKLPRLDTNDLPKDKDAPVNQWYR